MVIFDVVYFQLLPDQNLLPLRGSALVRNQYPHIPGEDDSAEHRENSSVEEGIGSILEDSKIFLKEFEDQAGVSEPEATIVPSQNDVLIKADYNSENLCNPSSYETPLKIQGIT